MAWLLIVIGLISVTGGVWTAGDERVVCRAAATGPSNGARHAADCRVQVRNWWGTRLYRDEAANGVEDFGVFVDRQRASDPNDAPNVTWNLQMTTHDGSRYRVAADPSDVEAAAGRARGWLSSGMDGEFVFVADAFGRGIFACLLGAGCVAGGVVGLLFGPRKR